ncbi:MAG TPA: DegT/DnrJ/EryC1/StrS family aminotransferase [Polyangia bacterium]|nr:DegT/DnrJ/EryC1/StrS family aminotransferase [Polyangia bacterium]
MEPIPFGKPLIGDAERAAISQVLDGTTLTHGPRVREFEAAFADFTGAPHAVATATCAASLHLAYMFLEIGPGDEVIVPAQTHVAMAQAVTACGGTPVFCDAEPETGAVDLEQLETLIGPATKAISVVHYLGLPVAMERVMELAREHDLFVVEDCAIALGARIDGTHVGLIGDIGCFSFYPVKHICTGEGGMVISRREDVADRVSKQRAFGIDKGVITDRRHTGEYDVQHFGLNYRLGEIGAAMGVEQLKRLPGFLERRESNFERLAAGLGGVEGLRVLDSSHKDEGGRQSSHYCLVALLDEPLVKRRKELIEALKGEGVGTSVYYPKPLPEMSFYAGRQCDGRQFPVAGRISYESIAFPVAPHVDEAGVDRIIEVTTNVIGGMLE